MKNFKKNNVYCSFLVLNFEKKWVRIPFGSSYLGSWYFKESGRKLFRNLQITTCNFLTKCDIKNVCAFFMINFVIYDFWKCNRNTMGYCLKMMTYVNCKRNVSHLKNCKIVIDLLSCECTWLVCSVSSFAKNLGNNG